MNEVIDKGEISDGYHTFNELYAHRHMLWIALCRQIAGSRPVWRSLRHSDGSSFDGLFVLGMYQSSGHQITYHLPISLWNDTEFAETVSRAPEWDGHTSTDVLDRLKRLP